MGMTEPGHDVAPAAAPPAATPPDARRPVRWLPAPAWLTWLLVAGLFAVYAGERIVPQVATLRTALTAGGTLLVFATAAWRFASWRRAGAAARGIERLFMLGHTGCAVGLAGFLLAGAPGDRLGIGGNPSGGRVDTALTVLSAILLAVSLLPVLAAHWASGLRVRGDRAPGVIDGLRVTRLAGAALTVALAGSFLMLVGYIASARDATIDVGYFRTATPGSAATRIAGSLGAPLRVLLFFPPANQVGDQVAGYFRALDAASDNVRVEQYDRLASPALAEEHQVTQDGTIVLAIDDRIERFALPTELGQARTRLRSLDEEVQRVLMRVAREQRTVYLTVGHGELNDPTSAGTAGAAEFQGVSAINSLFRMLNYRVADLGIQNGLGNEVPGDAAVVIVLGPQRPFLEPELAALDRFLAAGGALLLALEPETDFDLGPLRDRLGVTFHGVPLTDDRQHLRLRGNASDRRLIVTDRFSSHASVSTLGQSGVGAAIALPGAGALETVPVDDARATVVVRSLQSTFPDGDGDFAPDEESEPREARPLVVAVEGNGGSVTAAGAGDSPPMRAMVFADADMFSDVVISAIGLNAALVADAVRWLGGEEELAGETVSEEDIPIVHTRAEDVAWFHATIVGAPALVLALGLFGVARRRRRRAVEGRQA